MVIGKPLSTAYFIHEREEVRGLRRIGLNPFGPDGRDDGYYKLKHSKAIQVEFYYLKLVASDMGFKIPIPVLILFNPLLGAENREEYLWLYAQLRHDITSREIHDFGGKINDFVVNDAPEDLVPRKLQKQVKEFYKQLLAEEPKWGLLKF